MDNILDDLIKRTIRLFIKKGLRAGGMLALSPLLLSILNCAHDPYEQKPEEFTFENFDKWYKRNRLYNTRNPNLEGPHSTMHTFQEAFPNDWTPGISYNVPYGEIMVASAPGIVMNIYRLRTGRAGGKIVRVEHPDYFNYISYYAHLNKVYVKFGKHVKRGDPIGNVTEHSRYAKLMLKIGSRVDPDNYGINHSYMRYKADMDETFNEIPMDEIEKKRQYQWEIFYQFFEQMNYDSNYLLKMHKESGHGAANWSTLEYFKYLSTLYEVKPDLFPELSEEKVQSMKKEFYDNQPIVLTLPFRKGGMRKI